MLSLESITSSVSPDDKKDEEGDAEKDVRIIKTSLISLSHQTRSHSVPKIFVKRTWTVFGRSGHISDLLQT